MTDKIFNSIVLLIAKLILVFVICVITTEVMLDMHTETYHKTEAKIDIANSIEVYTPEDILYIDLNNKGITSESGNIDTIFNNIDSLKEYVSNITAVQSNINHSSYELPIAEDEYHLKL